MRMLRCLVAVALVCGLAGVAKADQMDFHMVVLDPFATTPIFTTPFQFTFEPCVAGQLPTNVNGSYMGCFSGVNRTGNDWAGMELSFTNTAALGSQPAGCALDGSTDFYQSATCSLTPDGSEYFLDFTIGSIPNNGSFVIAEDGVDPSDFPMVSATIIRTVTPEPGSIWLMSTGILMVGFFFAKRRWPVVRAPRF
ncbi:MAG: sorting protein [Edaphobacter sp.]|nr:sorting protein [Edaphobacter sp.]